MDTQDLKLKTKISIVLFIIILVIGLYIGSQVKREANKIRLKLQEIFSGRLAMNQINAQMYLNQSVLCVPNLNSNKSNDLQCQQSTINSTTVPNTTEFFQNSSQKEYQVIKPGFHCLIILDV